ncbi:unnamed protein product [Spirodela intermedia]|uniref:Uncharacterized protein n=2 Tax=Spirodela intermedia TaxID=51605 RepID=A0A7I8JYU0_SPIIN|nr:unnamed protein product [Spirodela intermedia]CAA6654566.1 unnamed protein product [Spirodela intermedia]CAA7389200.1 unnamed protein product [Spirodela intermedia]
MICRSFLLSLSFGRTQSTKLCSLLGRVLSTALRPVSSSRRTTPKLKARPLAAPSAIIILVAQDNGAAVSEYLNPGKQRSSMSKKLLKINYHVSKLFNAQPQDRDTGLEHSSPSLLTNNSRTEHQFSG